MSEALNFDPRRLTLARWSAHLTKRDLAERSGLSPASITQYEAGRTLPPTATLAKLALAVGMPVEYFERRQDRRRPDPAARSYFRSLRSTPQRDRDRADAYAEHVFDLVDYLDRRLTLPAPEIPQLQPNTSSRHEIEHIAAQVREAWQVPAGPVANVVRLLEAHGVVVVRPAGGDKLDAFSRWFGDRPLVLLWSGKDDKARSRFDAAHELGHLVMHSDPEPLDREQEHQANMFASAFLMPDAQIGRYLARRAPSSPNEWTVVLENRKHWGVSAKALLYRSRELGALNESAFRRAMISYNRRGLQSDDGSALGDPEEPLLLTRAIDALGVSPESVATDALVPRRLIEDLHEGVAA